MDVNILKRNSRDFPEVIRQIASPPQKLFWRGVSPQEWLDKPKVAVVGSRKITSYGRAVTTKLVTELARAGVVIISGLAYGVDITAHRAALDCDGVTVAVLPGSVNNIYPAMHAHTAEQITRKGTLMSEYEETDISFKSNFIARNRIVSALADVLLITEAAVNSGSLHTARFALEQGKTVMAVPGNITSLISEGTNNLIKSGAAPVTSADDVLFALGLSKSAALSRNFQGSPSEERVLELIREGIADQEELVAAAGLDSPQLSSVLTMLELGGYIRPAGGGRWLSA